VEVVASLSQGRTAAAQCGYFTYKSVPVIFEPPCTYVKQIMWVCQRVCENSYNDEVLNLGFSSGNKNKRFFS